MGSQQYFEVHRSNASLMSLAAESDMGAFTPTGIKFTGNATATAIMADIAALLAPINASELVPNGGEADNGPWGTVVWLAGWVVSTWCLCYDIAGRADGVARQRKRQVRYHGRQVLFRRNATN